MQIKSRLELYLFLPLNPVVAELGIAEGYLSRDILDVWKAAKLYMVDNWGKIHGIRGDGNFDNVWHDNNYRAAMQRIEPFKDRAVILRGITWDMAVHVPDESLDLLYLDACHEYDCVKKDLVTWMPKVKIGGIIAGHDINDPSYGVRAAVDEVNRRWKLIPENGHDASFYFFK